MGYFDSFTVLTLWDLVDFGQNNSTSDQWPVHTLGEYVGVWFGLTKRRSAEGQEENSEGVGWGNSVLITGKGKAYCV